MSLENIPTEELVAMLHQHAATPPAEPAPKDYSGTADGYGFPGAMANGLTLGFLPNLQAAAGAAVGSVANPILSAVGHPGGLGVEGESMGQTYDRVLADQQGQRAAYKDQHPLLNAAGNVAGGMVTGYGAAKSGATLLGRIPNLGLENLALRSAAGAAEGAGWAAASGFGQGEGGVENRVKGAVNDIPLGTIFGAAAPAISDAVSAIVSPVKNWYTALKDPDLRANQILTQRIMQDQTTPNALSANVEGAQLHGQPEYAVVDAAGKNTQRAGAMAAKVPGEFRDTVARDVAARQMGQGDRVTSYTNDAMGTKGAEAFATENAIAEARKAASGPLYEQAYQAPTPQGSFYDEMAARKSVQEASAAATRVAAEKQIPITDLFTDVPAPGSGAPISTPIPGTPYTSASTAPEANIQVPTTRGWDFIKRELDAKVNQLYQAGDTTAAEALKETRNALRGQLSADNPDYAKALSSYADHSAALDAVGTGRQLASASNADEAAAAFRELSDGGKDLARTGAAREFGVRLNNMRTPQDKTMVFDTPNMQSKLDLLATDPRARDILAQRLSREQDMVRANRALMGGSNTFENMNDNADLGAGSAIAALLTGHTGRAIGLAGGRGIDMARNMAAGMSEPVATRVGKYLMSTDPNEIRGLADMFGRLSSQATQPSIAPSVLNAGFNAPRNQAGKGKK